MRSITTGPSRATGTMIRNMHGTIMAASEDRSQMWTG